MGKVRFLIEYAVDLDKPEQIEVAKDFVAEDVYSAVKYNQVEDYFEIEEDSTLTEADIHEGLLELSEYGEDDNDVCEVCGYEFEDSEYSDDRDGRCCCENGHVFCQKHLVNTDDPEFEDEDAPEEMSAKFCPICNM